MEVERAVAKAQDALKDARRAGLSLAQMRTLEREVDSLKNEGRRAVDRLDAEDAHRRRLEATSYIDRLSPASLGLPVYRITDAPVPARKPTPLPSVRSKPGGSNGPRPQPASGNTRNSKNAGGSNPEIAAAERAAENSSRLSLQQVSEVKKAAQRQQSALSRLAPPPTREIERLKEAIKQLQKAEASKQSRADGESAARQVLAARKVPADIEALIAPALTNTKIPQEIREELAPAMAKVQDVDAHAPGIATQHVAGLEIGHSSARGSGGTLWINTVGGSGHAQGFAYEVIAASRFIDSARTPGNGGKALQIRKGESDLIFGQKLPAGPDRRTVEADVLIVQPGGHKVAVDSKSYARSLKASKSLQKQLDGVKHALREGEVHEFHFASRGPISAPAKALIEKVDSELRAELANASRPDNPTISQIQSADLDLSQPLICWHENLG